MKALQEVCLSDVADLSGGHAFKSEEYSSSGTFVLRTINIKDDHTVSRIGGAYIPNNITKKYERFFLKEFDTLFVMVGATLGKIGIVKQKDLPALLNQNIWVIRALPKKIIPLFLHYKFRELSQEVTGWVNGSARGFLRRDDVRNLKFLIPDMKAQYAIASILGALDDKIDLNHRTNETLEAMARALFRDWFVDFGPTRAKMAGQAPYLASEIWELFPDRLDDEGKPEGWIKQCLRDVLTLNYGKSLPSDRRVAGEIPVYGSGGASGFHNELLITGPAIIVGRKGTVGSLYWEDQNCFPIDTVFYVSSSTPLVYCFYLLQTLGLESMNTDAAVPGLNRDNAYRLEIPTPPGGLVDQFSIKSGQWRQKIRFNNEENSSLAQLRDLLLPKLMSGEIRIRDAEKMVGDAL